MSGISIPVFPNTSKDKVQPTSPPTPDYNCIAYAAGDDSKWWWPTVHAYWPDAATREETIEAFIEAYSTLGFAPCDDGELEEGFEKIALYSLANKPTHASRQLGSGEWSSKLGNDIDISHSREALSGGMYGDIIAYMKRPKLAAPIVST